MRKTLSLLAALAVIAVLPGVASADLLHDNGPLVNSPGTGFGGADESVLQSVSLGMNTLGWGHQLPSGYMVADGFDVTDAAGWDIDTFTFYAYQTGSGTASTMTAVDLTIYNGDPSAGGTPVANIYASLGNGLLATGFSNIYRVSETTGGANNRPIMADVVTAGITLAQGNYWLGWMTAGTLTSGPWAPPITINGQATTGDGLQSLDSGATWAPALDSGTATQQGFPFLVHGTVVPEPSALALLALGGLALIRRR